MELKRNKSEGSLDALVELSKNTSKSSLSDVFNETRGYNINEFILFTVHFNTIPNFIDEVRINSVKAGKWFEKTYKEEIKSLFFNKGYINESKKAVLHNIFYFLYDDLIVRIDHRHSHVCFLFQKTPLEKVEQIIAGFRKFRYRNNFNRPEISLLVNSYEGIGIKTFQITKPKLNIEDNYNDDFKEVHQTIIKRLSKKNDKGLVLLHGKPGTGKTSYIRYIITTLKKNVIFLPPNMAGSISNPDLISTLIDNPNSIFVIEDAENIVIDRDATGISPVTTLLNISDGLLSDCLNIQIICSFNTDISKVDNALLRKGRLIAKYEFKELETRKAQLLSNKLGFTNTVNEAMTLTDIYNQEERDFQWKKESKLIGFNA